MAHQHFLRLATIIGLFAWAAFADAQDRWQPASLARHTDAEQAAQLSRHHHQALGGDATAMFEVAEALWLGKGTYPNVNTAVQWYRQAADAGSAEAMGRLGDAFQLGVGIEQNFAEAMNWYQRGAEAGDPVSMAGVGWLRFNGLGVEANQEEGIRWYRRAAEAGGAEGMNNLGYVYRTGSGVQLDADVAVEWFQRAAEKGNAWAMDHLGEMFLLGEVGEPDVQRAVEWFGRAVAQEHPVSAVKLAEIYLGWHGHPIDYALARRWAAAAADLDDTEGMRLLGEIELEGLGGRADTIAALTWYSRSANRGNLQAAVDAAWVYLKGSGTIRRNPEQAMMILNQSSAAGNPLAMRALGDVYVGGAIGITDTTAAAQWYTRASEAGDVESMISLARLLLESDGDPADYQLAQKLVRDAADQGSRRAAELAEALWGSEPETPPTQARTETANNVTPVQYAAPDSWKAGAQDLFSAVRLTAADGTVLITVTALQWQPSQLIPNVNRWRFQIGLDPLDEAALGPLMQPATVDDAAGHRIDFTSPETAMNRRRTIGIIVPRGETAWFIKMIGPVDAIENQVEPFDAFVRSIKWPRESK